MAIADSPRQLHIEITTRCNLQCKMCVKFADGVSIPEQDFPFLLFQNMKKELKGVERLILNGIGEPLLHPQLEDFVAFARRQMPEKSEIGFQTNGLLMTEKRAESLVDAGLDLVCFSVDTLDAVKDGTLHAPASSKTGKAVEWFSGKDGVSVGVEVVLMRDTIEQLPLIVEWAAQAGADFVIGSHVMPYDPSMSEQSLFDHHTCGARELINEFKQRAAREGIPLEFARGSSLLNKRYSNEVQFYDWLKDLQKEAAARKEWLDVHQLLTWEPYPELPAIYKRAMESAEHASLDLRLPPMKAWEQRRCRFVEDDACFVTMDGTVSPCTFLMHDHGFAMRGERAFVERKQYGRLDEMSLGGIWQSQEFVNFREQARRYDYPRCFACSTAPCSDFGSSAISFELDCHGQTVPCGFCPWNLGGLQCL